MDKSNKRAHSGAQPFELHEAKRPKISTSLLDLSDCVLTLIFEYVNTFDLYSLSLVCSRFCYLIPARTLWSKVDTRAHPMCARKFKFFYENLNDSTRSLMVSGVNPSEKCITNMQFHKLGKLTANLTVLAMEYQFINSNEIQLRHFPSGLKELSLRGTQIAGCSSLFQEASLRLKQLHTLILDECKWVREHYLMPLSKFHNLQNLSVYKCKNLGDSVAYMSITTRFGFKKLLRIDARLTKMGDQFLKCLNNLRSIREIYLEGPNKSTRLIPRRSDINKRVHKHKLSNRKSDYCLNGFHPCDKEKCQFRPDDFSSQQVETNEGGNVIVVSPFEMTTDVRVHVLYGNDEFEHQNGRHEPEKDEEFDSEQEEILFNYFQIDDNPTLSMFYESSVSDDGIRWFTASDTTSPDDLGEESILFRRPFTSKCDCSDEQNDDWDKPGPSGLNKPDADEPEVILDVLPIPERRDLRVVIERVEPGVQIIVNNNNHANQNNLTRLKVFVVRNFNRLTDRAMQNLSGIRLELLDVTRTSISADAVKRFLLVNPDCRVIHESTCRCKPG